MDALDRKSIFVYEQAHPLVLDKLMRQACTPEWYQWERETIRMEVARLFMGLAHINWVKLQCIQTVYANPAAVFDQWQVFYPTVIGLNNQIPDLGVLQVPTVAQLYAGVDILKALDREERFSREVIGSIVAVFLHEGLTYAPDELSFIQWRLKRPYYVCELCGNEELIFDDIDGVCDVCSRDWHSRLTGVAKREPSVRIQFTHDETRVKRRLESALQNMPEFFPSDDITEDVQAAKLVVALQYRDMRREQLRRQLELLQL